jgi:hypothetical protein
LSEGTKITWSKTRNQLTTTTTMIERDMGKYNLPILKTENWWESTSKLNKTGYELIYSGGVGNSYSTSNPRVRCDSVPEIDLDFLNTIEYNNYLLVCKMLDCFRNMYCIICKYQSSLITLYLISLNYTYIWVKHGYKNHINENKEVKNNQISVLLII